MKIENEHLQQRLRDLRAQDRMLSMSDSAAHTQYPMSTFTFGSTPFGVQSTEDGFSYEGAAGGSAILPGSSVQARGPDDDRDVSNPKKRVGSHRDHNDTRGETEVCLLHLHADEERERDWRSTRLHDLWTC